MTFRRLKTRTERNLPEYFIVDDDVLFVYYILKSERYQKFTNIIIYNGH